MENNSIKIFPDDFLNQMTCMFQAWRIKCPLRVDRKYDRKKIQTFLYEFFPDVKMTSKVAILKKNNRFGENNIERLSTLGEELINYLGKHGYIKSDGINFMKVIKTIGDIGKKKCKKVVLKISTGNKIKILKIKNFYPGKNFIGFSRRTKILSLKE